MNLDETRAVLTYLGLACDKPIAPGMAEVWADVWADETAADVKRAAREWCREEPRSFLPAPGELIRRAEVIREVREDAAEAERRAIENAEYASRARAEAIERKRNPPAAIEAAAPPPLIVVSRQTLHRRIIQDFSGCTDEEMPAFAEYMEGRVKRDQMSFYLATVATPGSGVLPRRLAQFRADRAEGVAS